METIVTSGTKFANRYLIERLLGAGGMGHVYLARDLMFDGEEYVALKILDPRLSQDERAIKRFRREAQLARKVTDPSVVRTYDTGQENDLVYLTMEYVDGTSLRDKYHGQQVPLEECVKISQGICLGLSAVHAAGIIHRDLKPANIMLLSDGGVKLADFGVARIGFSSLTGANEVVGSAAYLAPEQWTGSDVSSASDIYSLGVILYEMLTGILPFDADNPAEFMCKHLDMQPVAPLEINSAVPSYLSELTLRLLAKHKELRPRSVQEVLFSLEAKEVKQALSSIDSTIEESSAYQESSDPLETAELIGSVGHEIPVELEPDLHESDAVSGAVILEASHKSIIIKSATITTIFSLISFYLLKATLTVLLNDIWSNTALSFWLQNLATILCLGLFFSLPIMTLSTFICGIAKGIKNGFTASFILSAIFFLHLSTNAISLRVNPVRLLDNEVSELSRSIAKHSLISTSEMALLLPHSQSYNYTKVNKKNNSTFVTPQALSFASFFFHLILISFYALCILTISQKHIFSYLSPGLPTSTCLAIGLLPIFLYSVVTWCLQEGYLPKFSSSISINLASITIQTEIFAIITAVFSYLALLFSPLIKSRRI
jgi:serine/threonine protein kinase